MSAETAARKARSRKARAEAGGKQISVMLTPAAAAGLAAHVAKGETISGVVNRLLTGNASAPKGAAASTADARRS